MYQYPQQANQQQQHPSPALNGALPQKPSRIPTIAIKDAPDPQVSPFQTAASHGAAATATGLPSDSTRSSNTLHSTPASMRKSCRNIAIYGHCKYENEGCPFDHAVTPTSPAKPPSIPAPFVPASAKARNAAVSASPFKGALSARNVAAAVFVPKSTGSSSPALSASTPSAVRKELNDDVASGVHDMSIDPTYGSGRATPNSVPFSYDADAFDPTFNAAHLHQDAQNQLQSPGSISAASVPRAYNPYEHMNEFGDTANVGAPPGMGIASNMDYYSAGAPVKSRQALQYHLYAPPLPHVSNLHPHHLTANAFFLSPNQREGLQRKQEAMHAFVPPPELGGPHVPEELHVYHSLVPLEHPGPSAPSSMGLPPGLIDPRMGAPGASGATGASGDHSKVFGYRSHSYKATCTLDGKRYVLRRLENFRLTHETAIGLVEKWRRIRHPSIVSVREAFTTRAFGDHSIVFVYDYHPLSSTLYAEHMTIKAPQPDRRTGRLQPVSMQVPERTLWSYLCQLSSSLRSIHSNGLAARCIEASKILCTAKNRVRINCCSIFDVIAYDPDSVSDAVQTQQVDDLANLGTLILSLGLNSMSAANDVASSLGVFATRYSAELKDVLSWLVGHSDGPALTVHALTDMLSSHLVDEMDSALNYNDLLENSLMKELENGRLVRLLCKFGFINERPEFDHDPRWAETGDRYVIKLFRDHVFHAVDEAGRPVVDLSHILTNLNKLDAGVDEKIMLTSRDEHSCLVVSYREIKNCVESVFQDLSRTR